MVARNIVQQCGVYKRMALPVHPKFRKHSGDGVSNVTI